MSEFPLKFIFPTKSLNKCNCFVSRIFRAEIICRKFGLMDGFCAQHSLINALNKGGHVPGINGRSPLIILSSKTEKKEHPPNNSCLVTHSHIIIPSAYTSTGKEYGNPCRISGASHVGLSHDLFVNSTPVEISAVPKSAICTTSDAFVS